MINHILARDNKNLKLVRQLKKKSVREAEGKFVVEGKKMVLEAAQYAAEGLVFVVASDEFCQKEPETISFVENVCSKVYSVPKNIFDGLCDTETPQGILAVVTINRENFELDDSIAHIIILDGVSEPGNMGTIIRTAEAFGFDGVYLMKGCTDIYSPKTVRATMGSVFRMRFKNGCSIEDVEALKNRGFSLVATTPDGNVALETFDVPVRTAVVIGNEAHGVCDEIMRLAEHRLKITMEGLAESLNAAVAAGIVMHWIKK